jgi:hypothetical protein
VGPLITLIKRICRKAVHWYVWPQTQELRQRLDLLEQREAEARQKLLIVSECLNRLLYEFGKLHEQMAQAEAARLASHAQLQARWGNQEQRAA